MKPPMVCFCTFAAFMALKAQAVNSVEIRVQHFRPSKMLSLMRILDQSWPGVTADDRRGVLVVKGNSYSLKSARDKVSRLDVPRIPIGVRLWINSPGDKVSYESTSVLLSQQTWKTGDDETGVSLDITPRVNEDGTVTVLIVAARAGVKATVVARHRTRRSFSVSELVRNLHDTEFYHGQRELPPPTPKPALPEIKMEFDLHLKIDVPRV